MKTPNFPFYTRQWFSSGEEWSSTAHFSERSCLTVSPIQNHIKQERYNSNNINTSEFDAFKEGQAELITREEFDSSFEKTLKQIVNLVEPC